MPSKQMTSWHKALFINHNNTAGKQHLCDKLDTKIKVYKAVVLPTLLYACETWTVYQRHAKRLYHFHVCCLRKLLKVRCKTKSRIQRGCKAYIFYKDTIKASLKDFNIPPESSWEHIALYRATWRSLIRKGADDYEA